MVKKDPTTNYLFDDTNGVDPFSNIPKRKEAFIEAVKNYIWKNGDTIAYKLIDEVRDGVVVCEDAAVVVGALMVITLKVPMSDGVTVRVFNSKEGMLVFYFTRNDEIKTIAYSMTEQSFIPPVKFLDKEHKDALTAGAGKHIPDFCAVDNETETYEEKYLTSPSTYHEAKYAIRTDEKDTKQKCLYPLYNNCLIPSGRVLIEGLFAEDREATAKKIFGNISNSFDLANFFNNKVLQEIITRLNAMGFEWHK